ncbi:hypothetical protein H0H93_010298 [Arthromyces matolae]|nr:hypothetical protein H0H93_010298 [Arthromyces matolae]
MCITAPATINGTNFAKPDSCQDKGPADWNVPYKACGGHWGTLKDEGCSDEPGFRRWGAQLLDITADWTDACTTHDATVKDEYFTNPTECKNSGLSGEWGYFEVMDSTCGVPPCPDDMAWDYENGMCMLCSWDGKTPPVKIDENQIAAEAPFWTRNPLSMKHTKHEIRSHLQKRVKCNPFNRPANVPQDVPYLPNDLQAWQDGHGHGPTVDIIAANATVREAFQVPSHCRRIYQIHTHFDLGRGRGRIRFRHEPQCGKWYVNGSTVLFEDFIQLICFQGGWIFANIDNPTRDFVVFHADAGRTVDSTNPPRDSLAIDLSYPQRTLARARPGYVMVADFHTHPGGYATDNYGNSAIPSPADNRSEWRRGVPGILIHTNGLTAYGPASRAQMDRAGPQGFPYPNRETNGHDNDRGRPLEGWRPERPQNQPKVTNAPPPAPSPGPSQSGKDELR